MMYDPAGSTKLTSTQMATTRPRMKRERPISIVWCSRHSNAACVSDSRAVAERCEDFDGGSADYSLKMLARVTPGPSGQDAKSLQLLTVVEAVG